MPVHESGHHAVGVGASTYEEEDAYQEALEVEEGALDQAVSCGFLLQDWMGAD